jgi:hypothetical protein
MLKLPDLMVYSTSDMLPQWRLVINAHVVKLGAYTYIYCAERYDGDIRYVYECFLTSNYRVLYSTYIWYAGC